MPKSSKSTKIAAKPASKSKAAKPKSTRVTVLGYSTTSVLKWMGANGWEREAAAKAIAKLCMAAK